MTRQKWAHDANEIETEASTLNAQEGHCKRQRSKTHWTTDNVLVEMKDECISQSTKARSSCTASLLHQKHILPATIGLCFSQLCRRCGFSRSPNDSVDRRATKTTKPPPPERLLSLSLSLSASQFRPAYNLWKSNWLPRSRSMDAKFTAYQSCTTYANEATKQKEERS